MTLQDIDSCVEMVAAQPDFRLQYGEQREPLTKALRGLVGSEGFRAYVFEENRPSGNYHLGVGAFVFLTDEFTAEAKKAPFFWVGAELVRRLLLGERPFLSDDEVRIQNSREGLTIFAWPLGFRTEDSERVEFLNYLLGSFIELVRGYKLKEYIGQTTDVEAVRASLKSGVVLLTKDGCLRELPSEGANELLRSPTLISILREQALQQVGSWSTAIFIYTPPVVGFSRSEQRLLLAALQGGTEFEMAQELEISISAVKKCWRSIYDRVRASGIGILPEDTNSDVQSVERGKEKKQLLLAYLREHQEELRPIDMKSLARNRDPQKPRVRTG
jgi:DNA-binding NarL/FixJ family response regulator